MFNRGMGGAGGRDAGSRSSRVALKRAGRSTLAATPPLKQLREPEDAFGRSHLGES